MTSKMLHIFDLDGTLIFPYMDDPNRDFRRVEILPGRREKLRMLRAQGSNIAIVTNQGGVAFGYQTLEETRDKLRRAIRMLELGEDLHITDGPLPTGIQHGQSLDLPCHVFMCVGHPNGNGDWAKPEEHTRRKPSPIMIYEAMTVYDADPAKTVFVGDRDEDRQAAMAAGVEFIHVDTFFGRADESN